MKVQVTTKSGRVYTNEGTLGLYDEVVSSYRKCFEDGEVKFLEFASKKDVILIPVANVEAVHIIIEEVTE
ncbi:hypothetical protein ARR50_15465 [Listeria monocytogenes]|uniref:hypothetical protein n=1 Tax=Listeria seeligeri TaxID=1640 RepID=UPI0010B70037|nr:hypothetical protein [Listeria seeligeri]EAC4922942.1 hypothetical protein [Listeria monocytogenes]EAD0667635.1 hypothetical protein [Listeria monocytogenes]EAE0837189.1 hypothetical protein [Listeria monocytogenes]EAE0840390.1 hypothetical protein [Listeria monocytogenes]MBF2584531.1 hypothetical protein [Listeria seeligeri]